MGKFDKIIIYGYYPEGSHTHSFIHAGYDRAFRHLGYNVLWAGRDRLFQEDFKNALVFTEGFADAGLPLEKSSTYVVHYLGNRPHRQDKINNYLNNVGRLVDLRYNANCWIDKNYDYHLDRAKATPVGSGMYFEKGADGYDIAYTTWATDLLPNEINLEDRFLPRKPVIHYIGTVGGGQGGLDDCQQAPPEYDNKPDLLEFREVCRRNNIEFKTNCPWKNPISNEESKRLVQESFIAPDFRHKAFKSWGYFPCRIVKNISYGQMPGTNSHAVMDFCKKQGYNIPFSESPTTLFHLMKQKPEYFSKIEDLMVWVRDNHTYINRAKELLECLAL